ncbi:Hypothetical predicted protein [Cloeon dipterum]|uniref:Gametogenetin-binding protein 2 n=1 Tax=Cloeon dipterum TaxID=197152 RepID=A0A8S1CVD8_9INSE|nr:Hypothetical predicted protein [Cloeon dipterum]
MAKLVDVYVTEENTPIKKRQLPLDVDENLSMILDLTNSNIIGEGTTSKGKDYETFLSLYSLLSFEDINKAFRVNCKDVLDILSQTIPCVGCRRSVEKMFYTLKKFGHPTFHPIEVTKEGFLIVNKAALEDPPTLCALLRNHENRLNSLADGPQRSKKRPRCTLHTLETQRHRGAIGNWLDVWDAMYPICREEALLVETSVLLQTLEAYLRKHRFCTECRNKVLQAYSLLVADGDTPVPPDGIAQPTAEELKGYQKGLYDGIEYCSDEKHLHIKCSTDFVSQLINRAEPELNGSRRERHAKTLEVAQEEVLTCIGLCLYDRLHRIQQRLREEERTAKVLAAAATQALGRNFQLAVDEKRGMSKLMLLYEEITKEELAKEIRKENKKQKRKKKKEKKAEEKESNCECGEEQPCKDPACLCEDCDDGKDIIDEKKKLMVQQNCSGGGGGVGVSVGTAAASCDSCQSAQKNPANKWSARCSSQQSHDFGYSSEGNETISGSCSLPSSPEGSEVACSDGFCNHDDCAEASKENNTLRELLWQKKPLVDNGPRTLLQMLEDTPTLDEEDSESSFIPAEDVKAFEAQMEEVKEKRRELREILRARFEILCNNPC